MGRPAFIRFLSPPRPSPAGAEPGVYCGGEYAPWSSLLARGRDRSRLVTTGGVYAVDPAAGLESFASLFAVATVAETTLLWASAADLGVPARELGPALYEVQAPELAPVGRPLWAVATSGSSGAPKFAVGYADGWELVALHYDRAIFQSALADGPPGSLATCLPLKFSAAFFMTVLPAMFLRRELIVFPGHDWAAALDAAQGAGAVVLATPAIAAAYCLGLSAPVATPRLALLLGGGHLSADRVERIRSRLDGAAVSNLYGTAETGALCIDEDPGHNEHVGFPIAGKAVWLQQPDASGVGAIAAAGPDCCRATWRAGEGLTPNPGFVANTDYGRFDAQGRLCLEGRVDGAEKLMGVLIQPRAVERHLLALDGVADAHVKVEHADNGLEYLSARVIGSVTQAQVREHCAALPELERPRRIECAAEGEIAVYSAHGKLR